MSAYIRHRLDLQWHAYPAFFQDTSDVPSVPSGFPGLEEAWSEAFFLPFLPKLHMQTASFFLFLCRCSYTEPLFLPCYGLLQIPSHPVPPADGFGLLLPYPDPRFLILNPKGFFAVSGQIFHLRLPVLPYPLSKPGPPWHFQVPVRQSHPLPIPE